MAQVEDVVCDNFRLCCQYKKHVLRLETTMDLSAPVGMLRERLFEEWSLSQNGKILTRKIRLIDDNENQVYQYGDAAPSRIEEWTETYRLIPQSEIDKLIKSEVVQ